VKREAVALPAPHSGKAGLEGERAALQKSVARNAGRHLGPIDHELGAERRAWGEWKFGIVAHEVAGDVLNAASVVVLVHREPPVVVDVDDVVPMIGRSWALTGELSAGLAKNAQQLVERWGGAHSEIVDG
jgi:hypothetical protein